ncbi:DM13 domain-containing protein [Nostoc sp. FACHB-87]|uniref:DM13 domain-containing protein n=1 Tax=Nostocales TaxID=1161 RepID=UPI001688AAF9|nr:MULTISPECIES: DM13 domain-containing protein [Nostocales]MBD2454988.1 DM13 domain-containing protein [Nostoc sp. FACHB-87]MBD2474691.1 DM13 domain-containing protein [Anabaena sp. FACHB-83]MBD2488035.1 DM13 domain-containing protein [Aulosira sp. FACHB-615]
MHRQLLILSLATVAIMGCTTQVQTKPTENSTIPGVKSVQTTETTTSTTATPNTVVKSGNFVKGEHITQGNARIITENGKTFLEFDQNFKTDSGPDLLVILHRQQQPKIYGITEKEYVSLGRLQKTSGSQRYDISENIKVADFASAVIWCRTFNATFGYAAFN